MTSGFFLDLLPRKEDDENYSEGVVAGEEDPEQPRCKPKGIFQTGQSSQDDLFTEETRQGGQTGEGRSGNDKTDHGDPQ